MKKRTWLMGILCGFALTVSACSKSEEAGSTGTTTGEQATQAETASKPEEDPLAKKGKAAFIQLQCNTCHMHPTAGKNYPDLRGLYGKTVKLKDGSEVVADEAYLEESIRYSNKHIVAGYEPSMPDYSHLKDDQVKSLVPYIKSLKDEKPEFGHQGSAQ